MSGEHPTKNRVPGVEALLRKTVRRRDFVGMLAAGGALASPLAWLRVTHRRKALLHQRLLLQRSQRGAAVWFMGTPAISRQPIHGLVAFPIGPFTARSSTPS